MKFPSPFLALGTLVVNVLAVPVLEARTTPLVGWTVRKFSRNCTDPNICTYYLSIDLGDGKDAHQCTVTHKTDPLSVVTNKPFYGLGCAEGLDFVISWGWDYPGDFTVLTVVQSATQLEAFFGYKSPNAGFSLTPPTPIIKYADVGPNSVQHV